MITRTCYPWPGPRGFSWNFAAFEHVWGYCTCTINFINSTSKKKFVVDAFWGEHLSILSRYSTFFAEKKIKENCSSQLQHFGHTFGHFCSLDPWFPRPFLLNQGAEKKEFVHLSCPILKITLSVKSSAGEYPGSERSKEEKWKDTHESASSQFHLEFKRYVAVCAILALPHPDVGAIIESHNATLAPGDSWASPHVPFHYKYEATKCVR